MFDHVLVRSYYLSKFVIVKISESTQDGLFTSNMGALCMITCDKITHLEKIISVQSLVMDKVREGRQDLKAIKSSSDVDTVN